MQDVSDLVDEAKRVDFQEFINLVTSVSQLVSRERATYRKAQITGRLVRLPPSGEVTVLGDIHGDLDSLKHVLEEVQFVEKASSGREGYLVFLGDYGDRGPYSPEVYYVVLSLKKMFPEKVVLLQGNHEGPEDLLAHPHDLPYHLQRKFSANWLSAYQGLSRLFRRFYTAVLVDRRCIMLHGGVPSEGKTLEDVAYAYEKHPTESHLEEILWSDPAEGIKGTYPSPRGAGNLFGEDVTNAFVRMLDVRFLIRGHEPAGEGYKIDHGGKILTLFSRKGSPYSNRCGAYVTFDLSEVFGYAWNLEPFVRKF